MWVTHKEGIKRGLILSTSYCLKGAACEVRVMCYTTNHLESWLLWKRDMGVHWRVLVNAN